MSAPSGGNPSLPLLQQQQPRPIARAAAWLGNAVQSLWDWLPFIVVQFLQGICSPVVSLGSGMLAAGGLLAMKRCLDGPSWSPKTLDLGQFILFGALLAAALLVEAVCSNRERAGAILVLWFNPFTTGGVAGIMWASIARGRPFVWEYLKGQMPDAVCERLMAKKWFRDQLEEVAWFWVRVLVAMTLVVCIQPLLVTISFDGEVSNDASGDMEQLGNFLTCGQFVILGYGIWKSWKAARRQEEIKRRVREVKESGLSRSEALMYPPVSVCVEAPQTCQARAGPTDPKKHHVRTLTTAPDLDTAARILADAFEHDDLFAGFLETAAGKQSFYRASIGAMACFNQVLGCFESGVAARGPRAIMAATPVLSKSQEEIDVFGTYPAWLEHGFSAPGATAEDFPLPDDALVKLGALKKGRKHGLTTNPYLYIAYFGADPPFRGHGYGRVLLQHIIRESEDKKLPLVLETTNAFNVSQYERYAFQVVDRVEDRPEWVLMVRRPMGNLSG